MSGISSAFSRVLVQQPTKALLQYTTVRFRRKPRWLGTAKSKLFRVPERKQQLEDEALELKRLHNNYRTQMKAVRKFLRDEVEALQLVSRAGLVIQTPEEEEAEWQQAQQLNDDWNRKVAQVRDTRLSDEREERKKLILDRLVAKEQRNTEHKAAVDAKVREAMEAAKHFITRDNVDKAIELALVQPMSYNFALDKDGNIHRGESASNTEDTSAK